MAPLNLIAKTAAWLLFSLACGLCSPSEYMNHIPGLHASSFISPECQLREKLQTTDHLLARFHVFHVFHVFVWSDEDTLRALPTCANGPPPQQQLADAGPPSTASPCRVLLIGWTLLKATCKKHKPAFVLKQQQRTSRIFLKPAFL